MPARVTVFCRKPVGHVQPEALTRELRDADLMTLAEALDRREGEEEAVREMWRHYRLDGGGLDGLRIHWHRRQRPIRVSHGPPLGGEIEEVLDELPDDEPRARRVRDAVRGTVEVVSFEMGIDGSRHVAATIAEVLAFFFAEQGDGIVRFYGGAFAAPADRGVDLWP